MKALYVDRIPTLDAAVELAEAEARADARHRYAVVNKPSGYLVAARDIALDLLSLGDLIEWTTGEADRPPLAIPVVAPSRATVYPAHAMPYPRA